VPTLRERRLIIRRVHWNFNKHSTILHPRREGGGTGLRFRMIRYFACFQVEFPRVQGAHDHLPGHDAVGKRASTVWAAIFDRQDPLS